MKEKTHNNLKKVQLFVAISLLLVSVGLLFKNPGITGHFSADFQSQILDIDIEQSQSYLLATNTPEEIYISSFRISGEIQGEGSVEIFIEDQGQQFLIYKNVREKERGMSTITGMAVAPPTEEMQEPVESTGTLLILEKLGAINWDGGLSLSGKEEFVTGSFNNKCKDTCFIEMSLSSEETYKLVFMVEPGTKVKLDKIIYTLKN